MKIYTKKGDQGNTNLFDGSLVPKSEPRVGAYGDVDELNAVIGAARAFIEDKEINTVLLDIQKDLFAVGAQLADPQYDETKRKEKTKITPARVEEFEKLIDRFEEHLPPLKGFILPAGSPGGALLHVARTVARRAERNVVQLSQTVPVRPILIIYMNRLSDLLFVLARAVNQKAGEQQVPW